MVNEKLVNFLLDTFNIATEFKFCKYILRSGYRISADIKEAKSNLANCKFVKDIMSEAWSDNVYDILHETGAVKLQFLRDGVILHLSSLWTPSNEQLEMFKHLFDKIDLVPLFVGCRVYTGNKYVGGDVFERYYMFKGQKFRNNIYIDFKDYIVRNYLHNTF